MEIYPTIEALLHYANAQLLFDELDYVFGRNRIMELLNLSDYEEYEINDDELDSMANPSELLDALCAYAVSKKIITEQETTAFAQKLIACVLKRPSEIADIFEELPAQKAFEWLGDYGLKSCYIRPPVKRWDGKGTKGKIEVVHTGCDATPSNEKYPLCRFCRDAEGFKDDLNMRTVPIELYGERMFFYYYKNPLTPHHGNIVGEYHRAPSSDKVALNKMFDFLSLCPSWTIASKGGEHENYSVSSRLLPFNKAPDMSRFKSKEYPYIAISTIDWYIGGVRLATTNREKLIEYAEKMLAKWREAESGNDAAVSLRKQDSNFVLEALLFNSNKAVPEDFANISGATTVTSLMGVFSVNKQVEQQLKHIERFLTKEEKFSAAKLEGDLKPHAAMIQRLIASAGNSKPTELEASLDVKDEVNKTLENALTSLNVSIEVLYGDF